MGDRERGKREREREKVKKNIVCCVLHDDFNLMNNTYIHHT